MGGVPTSPDDPVGDVRCWGGSRGEPRPTVNFGCERGPGSGPGLGGGVQRKGSARTSGWAPRRAWCVMWSRQVEWLCGVRRCRSALPVGEVRALPGFAGLDVIVYLARFYDQAIGV